MTSNVNSLDDRMAEKLLKSACKWYEKHGDKMIADLLNAPSIDDIVKPKYRDEPREQH